MTLTVPGGALLNALLKHVFRRARPLFDDPLLVLTTYSASFLPILPQGKQFPRVI
jgi:hypothetical protein